ncbi:hypothetical protein [Chelatococcus asaccharovorans]|uniref:Uncharacterized protein n=1 Tax=Chelatococcus asaccharovorans TaxID=28210 RepID=A0A2V3TY08_9HYPH|nr:hypothetical protein [Chelatococcus asaccharovorans]MBS7704772.1 hypothetical protein [Chelatococcus asaccharovorans]PXW54669.1 hypothetical protein C7450_111201 [Chelatococcus asaccharovorans]
MADQNDVLSHDIQPAPTHPEEMTGVFNLHVGNWMSLQASGRMTPAGMVAIGLTLAAFAATILALARLRK